MKGSEAPTVARSNGITMLMKRFHSWLSATVVVAIIACAGTGSTTITPTGTAPASGETASRPTATLPDPTQAAATQLVAPTMVTPDGEEPPAPTESPIFTPTVPATEATRPSLAPVSVTRTFPNLSFDSPTNLAQPDDSSTRLFISEQDGRVLTFASDQDVAEYKVFLDISGRASQGNNEEGLLGLAFDPAYRLNGYFYVYYSASNPRRSVVSRFSVGNEDPGTADDASEFIILEVPQPAGNHNGGQLAFGPDGHLYVGFGDGGGAGDPMGNGQNRGTLLGSILRIDVTQASQGEPYRVPPDNPFADNPDAKDEIWAYGLRNPWRFSFDTGSSDSGPGRLWAGDVGQNGWEEIDLIEKGLNYGWNVMEGAHCFPPGGGCDETGLQLPVAEYSRREGCSVIGGYVYRGAELPFLNGVYLYGDFCSGEIWGLDYDGQAVTHRALLAETDLRITSFGRDQAGNIYVLSRNSGIYTLTSGE